MSHFIYVAHNERLCDTIRVMAVLSRTDTHGVFHITEINRICLVLLDVNNRLFCPYLAAIHRNLISVMLSAGI
jgi:hypothetical protein